MKKTDKNMLKLWGSVFLVNAASIYVISLLYPNLVVLGNDSLSPITAVTVTSLILTLVLAQGYPATKVLKLKIEGDLAWNVLYAVINILGLWVIARAAIYTGFGIASFLVAIILGLILAGLQLIVWKTCFTGKKR